MGTVLWLIMSLLVWSQSNARPFYDDVDYSNAKFLEALLYEKTETLKAAISLLSQLNLPLLCQSVAADPHAKFATVADLLHFATVVVQSQENMTSNHDDLQEYTPLPTEIPFEKLTSVYPKAVTETVSLELDQATRPAFPNSEMLENGFKPIEELDRKDINGKLLEKELVINSHDSIKGENGFESESRLMKNKTKAPQDSHSHGINTKLPKMKKVSQKQKQSTTTKIHTTEAPDTETVPQTTESSTYVTLESENSFTELPYTQRPRRPDESYYGRSDQKPSQPTSGHSRPGFTTPLHWLIREKWPQMEKSTQELLKEGKLTSEELSREIVSKGETDNNTRNNHTEESLTSRKPDTTHPTIQTTTTTTHQHKHLHINSTESKMTTVTKRMQPSTVSRTTKVSSSKSSRISNSKTTTSHRQNSTDNETMDVTVTVSPSTPSSSLTPRKSPYLTTKLVAKTSSQAPTTSTSTDTHSTLNTSEIIRSNETKQTGANSKSSLSKSVKPIFTTINITQILELTKTASPGQSTTQTAPTKTNVPTTKITSTGLAMTTKLKTSTVPTRQTKLGNNKTTTSPSATSTTLPITSQSQTTKSSHNLTATTEMSNTTLKPLNETTSQELQTLNITKIATSHLPPNLTTVSNSRTEATTSAIKSTITQKSTSPKFTSKLIPVLKHDNSLENTVKVTDSQKPSLREKIVPVQNSRDSDRSDIGDYGNEITQEEKKDYIAPGQNGDDSFGFFTCPTIFGFYPDAINCGQFYICSWSIPYHFDCPVGTVWNPELTVCDWPFNVNCGTRPWFGQTAFEKHFLPNQL